MLLHLWLLLWDAVVWFALALEQRDGLALTKLDIQKPGK